jgi:hypothetical protein
LDGAAPCLQALLHVLRGNRTVQALGLVGCSAAAAAQLAQLVAQPGSGSAVLAVSVGGPELPLGPLCGRSGALLAECNLSGRPLQARP